MPHPGGVDKLGPFPAGEEDTADVELPGEETGPEQSQATTLYMLARDFQTRPAPSVHFTDEEGLAIDEADVLDCQDEEDINLRKLILGLDKKLSIRFDSLEANLESMGRQITNQLNSCPVAPFSLDKTFTGSKVSSWQAHLERRESPGHVSIPKAQPGWQQPHLEKTDSSVSSSSISLSTWTRAAGIQEPMSPARHRAQSGTSTLWEAATSSSPKFTLRSEWQTDLKPSVWPESYRSEEAFKTLDDLCQEDVSDSPDRLITLKPWYILWPSSYFRLGWDLVTMVLVAHDMAVIPVHMGFSIDDNVFSRAFFYPFLFFWSADIPLTFVTGFYRNGRVEMSLSLIAKNYLTTWFLLDLAMVSSSWAEVFIGIGRSDGLELGRVGKTLRVLRIVRSMRLLRLVKLRRIIEDIQDRITSEYFHIIIAVFKLSVVIVWTNHFIACTWWGIGASGPREGDDDASTSWTSHFGFQSVPLSYQYFTSLHWSLTQFTPASMEVSPRNLGERMFAVAVLIFAMIVFSSFVSSITAAMTQLRNLGNTVDKSFVMLRRYLRGHKIPTELNQRIVRCVQNGLITKKEEIPESDVELLRLLSPSLHMELLAHVYSPLLLRHPFFSKYADMDPIALQRMCLRAVSRVRCASGDVLFTQYCSGDHMFFVLKGKFRYLPAQHGGKPHEEEEDCVEQKGTGQNKRPWLQHSNAYQAQSDFAVGKGEWFCEPSLWCSWAHTGSMRAIVYSEILVIDPIELARVTGERRLVLNGARKYGEAFVKRLNFEARDGMVSDISPMDLEVIAQKTDQAFAPDENQLGRVHSNGHCKKLHTTLRNSDGSQLGAFRAVKLPSLPSRASVREGVREVRESVRDVPKQVQGRASSCCRWMAARLPFRQDAIAGGEAAAEAAGGTPVASEA